MPKDTFFNLTEKKRNRIIDSAMLEFSKAHYNKVTIDSIVNGAGIPKGSFYQYFKNKDDLYKYLFSRIGNRKKNILQEIKRDVDSLNFKEYVIKVLEEAEKFDTKNPKIAELKNKFINQCPQEVRKEVLKNEIPKSFRILEESITAYIQKGELRKDLDVKKAAYMITSFIVNFEQYEFTNEDSFKHVMAQMLDILMQGMKQT